MRKVASTGSVEERLRRLEQAWNFQEYIVAVTAVTDDVTTGGGGGGASVQGHREEFAGPDTAFDVSVAPLSETELVTIDDNTTCRKVSSLPGLNEYTFSGTTVTLGSGTLTSGSVAIVRFLTGTGVTGHRDEFSGPATTLVLSSSPMAETEAVYIDENTTCRKVGSSPGLNEYTMSGGTITLGAGTCGAGSVAWVVYLT